MHSLLRHMYVYNLARPWFQSLLERTKSIELELLKLESAWHVYTVAVHAPSSYEF